MRPRCIMYDLSSATQRPWSTDRQHIWFAVLLQAEKSTCKISQDHLGRYGKLQILEDVEQHSIFSAPAVGQMVMQTRREEE